MLLRLGMVCNSTNISNEASPPEGWSAQRLDREFPLVLEADNIDIRTWGSSSVGRALAWHARRQGFDSPHLHEMRLTPTGGQLEAAIWISVMMCITSV